jgi:hypothetical protein
MNNDDWRIIRIILIALLVILLLNLLSCKDFNLVKEPCEMKSTADMTIRNTGVYPIYVDVSVTDSTRNQIRVLQPGKTTVYRIKWGEMFCFASLAYFTDTTCSYVNNVNWTKLRRFLPLCGQGEQKWTQSAIK